MDERFSARMYVEYFARERGISADQIGVAPVVVLSWGQKVIEYLVAATQAARCPHWFYDEDHVVYPLYTSTLREHRVSFALAPEGAPATVVMMEELIACGARVFLGLGWAGSLQYSNPVGSMIVPVKCLREEGTSPHYLADDDALWPDAELVELLLAAGVAEDVPIVTGLQWTTDAPYRELNEKVDRYRRGGVVGVDMETSAMYALGRVRSVRVCNLLVVSDELWADWNPAFRSGELRRGTRRAERVILRCLADDLGRL